LLVRQWQRNANEFFQEHHVPHGPIGKLMVAVSEAELDKRSAIKGHAQRRTA
jgi:hypothetical protein